MFAPAGNAGRLEQRSRFLDVCAGRRMLAYDFTLDGRCRWASLVAVDLEPSRPGTRLSPTEQYTRLDGGDGKPDAAHLERGTWLQLNALAAAVEG